MYKTLSEILKSFAHLVRELFIYFTSGIIVVVNILTIDYFYYNQLLYNAINSKFLILVSVISCYVIGHICMAFYYLLLELTGFNKKMQKCKKIDIKKERLLPKLYQRNKELYIQFIERYDNLFLMRWNLSAAFFINFITTFIYTYFIEKYWQISLLNFLFLIFSILMYLLYLETEKEYIDRIEYINKIKNK